MAISLRQLYQLELQARLKSAGLRPSSERVMSLNQLVKEVKWQKKIQTEAQQLINQHLAEAEARPNSDSDILAELIPELRRIVGKQRR